MFEFNIREFILFTFKKETVNLHEKYTRISLVFSAEGGLWSHVPDHRINDIISFT